LGRRARQLIERDAQSIHVSAGSVWEIAVKAGAGKLRLRDSLDLWMPDIFERYGFVTLDITVAHAVAVAALPRHHPDPFDRLLIAQAQLEDLTIVTSDTAFADYDVKLVDARA
jgi:PIN domain nuclease of toxin-antitoxin system